MKKIKYFYNAQSLKFEKWVVPLRVKLLRVFGFISGLLVACSIVIYLYVRFFPKPLEIEYKRKYELVKYKYEQLNDKIRNLQQQMAGVLTNRKRQMEKCVEIFLWFPAHFNSIN